MDAFKNLIEIVAKCLELIQLSETVRKNSKDRVQMMLDWNKSGATNIDLHPEVMELLDKQHDPNANVRPCLMASFGSNWMVIRVIVNQFIFNESQLEEQNLFNIVV